MRFKLLALIAALGCISASAHAALTQGSAATISGRVHIVKQGDGTYLYLNGSSSLAGVVPFENGSAFPDLNRLDGRDVQITGVVNGHGQVMVTNPSQIKVTD